MLDLVLELNILSKCRKNCCVPKCTKKGYLEEEKKILYFKFPQEKHLFDEWIRAIRRDVGRHFKVTENTRVCSRHFKDGDFEVSLTGRRTLPDGAVPSRFEWKWRLRRRESPQQNQNLTPKIQTLTVKVMNQLVNQQAIYKMLWEQKARKRMPLKLS